MYAACKDISVGDLQRGRENRGDVEEGEEKGLEGKKKGNKEERQIERRVVSELRRDSEAARCETVFCGGMAPW